ncbi:MAG TPA: DegT/DnrJ/EryC1/StrS aminotransferase family protein [Candidatus Acidoferrum sp.]|jgi:dTDP-4-amino-4,6-dideoxygalactose transaminase|nr:DegT/DnrJ/EryC1/StrS aminotransferase family protein [Candidatus Acidoferrum sp.]
MRKTFLPFSPPLIGEEEIAEVADTLRSDWITTGPKVKRFEQEFATAVNAPAALAVNSCTAALHVALATLGVGPGDAVITTPMTFCSTVHVIEHVGARPILVDVEPGTLNLDPNRVRETLALLKNQGGGNVPRVKAIIPVHLYGHPCDMDALLEIASEYECAIIEDAAHALPAEYKRKKIGSLGGSASVPGLSCFSFYATKNMTTAEGGMLTGSAELLEEARIWSLHGMSHDAWQRYGREGTWHYDVTRPGFKYNMTDIQAALGLHQLRKLNAFHRRRREIAARYNQAFRAFGELETPTEHDWAGHAWHLYVLRLNSDRLAISRNQFISELQARNIGTSVHFIPIHLHSYYREKYGYSAEDFPLAYSHYQRIISLPCYPRMGDEDVEDVISAVTQIVGAHTRLREQKARSSQPVRDLSFSVPIVRQNDEPQL